jgi:acetyl esterase/lipase
MIRYRHLFQLKLKPEVWDQNTSIIAFREQAESTNARLANTMPKGVEVVTFDIDGMKAEWLIPDGAGKEKVIMYCIGGGYVSGSFMCLNEKEGDFLRNVRICSSSVSK